MNHGGKVQLVIVDVLRNLPIIFILKNPFDILAYNWKVDEYIATIFDFAKKFLAFDGVVVNSLPLMNIKDPSLKVLSQSLKLSLYFSSFLFKLKSVL